MYITDKVFLHMIKTAGSSVHRGIADSGQTLNYNQRHASINHLPERYKNLPRYGIIRSPESWYKSFYNFFVPQLSTNPFMKFMWSDSVNGQDKILDFNTFVLRSINMKDTLIKYPEKAMLFRDIFELQTTLHFTGGYLDGGLELTPNKKKVKPESLEQFNMSLYEWFYRGVGLHTSTNVPMEHFSDLCRLFGIKELHDNAVKTDLGTNYNPKTLKKLQKTHQKFYKEIENYKGV